MPRRLDLTGGVMMAVSRKSQAMRCQVLIAESVCQTDKQRTLVYHDEERLPLICVDVSLRLLSQVLLYAVSTSPFEFLRVLVDSANVAAPSVARTGCSCGRA